MTNTYKEQAEFLIALTEQINSGYHPTVRVNNEIYEECFLEQNMMAKVVAAHCDDPKDNLYEFVLDFSDFHESNKAFAGANYFDMFDKSIGMMTAEEAGYRPTYMREAVYCAISNEKCCFDVVDEPRLQLFQDYIDTVPKAERKTRTYIHFLEESLLTTKG